MRGRLVLAGCFFLLWSVSGFLLGWGWFYCCGAGLGHGSFGLVIIGTMQGLVGGLLIGALIVASKSSKPHSSHRALAIGLLTALVPLGLLCLSEVVWRIDDTCSGPTCEWNVVSILVVNSW